MDRRRDEDDEDDHVEEEEDEEEEEDDEEEEEDEDEEEDEEGTSVGVGTKRRRPAGIPSQLAPDKLKAFEEAERKKGLIYLSRIPPFMKPVKVRHLLSTFGEIGRIYLAPEDAATHAARVKAGGNKKLMFVEGWVEFTDKSQAKIAALTLNNTPMGGNKRGFYGSDLWSMKYLHGFKWHHLTEKIAYEKRIRTQRLRAEMAVAKKEAEQYMVRADLAKTIEAKEARLEASGKRRRVEDAAGGAGTPAGAVRHYAQKTPLPDKLLDTKGGKR